MSNFYQGQDPQTELAEQGMIPPDPVPDVNRTPGDGKLVLPHFATFGQIVNLVSRTYRWTFDEALKHSHKNSLAIRRDPVVMDALRARQVPVCQFPWHIDPCDDSSQADIDACKGVTQIIQEIPNFQQYRMMLQEAIWFGRSAVQNVYGFDFHTGRRRMVIAKYHPINGDKLVFKYSGRVGVVVHSTYASQHDTEITDRARAHFFTEEEREQIVLHSHEPEDADFFEGDLAGAVHGVGIRSRIYWFWWLRSQVMSWLLDYIERVGAGGFTIYFYEAGNPDSLKEVKTAAEEQWRNNSILFPRYRDNATGGPGIQRIDPSNSGADLLRSLVIDYFDAIIRRYILQQTLSSEAQATGLGSGVANFQEDTFNRVLKYDAINQQETLTRDLVKVLYRYNYPGIRPGRFIYDVDKPNVVEIMQAAKFFYEMGGQVDEDEIRSVAGLSKPKPGSAILSRLPQTAPTGGGQPVGVPIGQPEGPNPDATAINQGQAEPAGGDQPVLFAARDQKIVTTDQPGVGDVPSRSLTPTAPIPENQAAQDLDEKIAQVQVKMPYVDIGAVDFPSLLSHQHLTPGEATALSVNDMAKFAAAYQGLQSVKLGKKDVHVEPKPDEEVIAEAARHGIVAKEWYYKTWPVAKALFPSEDHAERFLAVLAGSSPRMPVTANFELAIDIMREWMQKAGGKSFWNEDEHQQLLAQHKDPDKAQAAEFGLATDRAKKFLSGLSKEWRGRAIAYAARHGYVSVRRGAENEWSYNPEGAKLALNKYGKLLPPNAVVLHKEEQQPLHGDEDTGDEFSEKKPKSELPTGIVSLEDENGQTIYTSWGSLADFGGHLPNVAKALSVPDNTDWNHLALSGFKVDSFRQNNRLGKFQGLEDKDLPGIYDEIKRMSTNDAWASYLAGVNKEKMSNRYLYVMTNVAGRRAADRLNAIMPGEDWEPHKVQAAGWSFLRALSKLMLQIEDDPNNFPPMGEDEVITHALQSITHGHVQDSIDFMSAALHNPKIISKLKALFTTRVINGQLVKDPQGGQAFDAAFTELAKRFAPLNEQERATRVVSDRDLGNDVLRRVGKIAFPNRTAFRRVER